MAFDLVYLGHSAFEIRMDDKSILIDPFLQATRMYDYRDYNITDILITHGHTDHVGNAIDIAKSKRSTIIAIFELANYCASKGTKTFGVNFGSWIKFDWGKALFVPAFHSSSSMEGIYTGEPAGIILDVNGVKLYHAGDTCLFSDMKLIKELYNPDVAMLPIGGLYTMDIEHAAIAAEWIGATITIPMHYNTFEPIEVDAEHFNILLQTKGLNCQIMNPEDVIQF